MRSLRVCFATVLAIGATAVPARAQESPLAQIPEKAPLVVHLRGYERVKGRLFTAIRTAIPGLEGLQFVRSLNRELQNVLGERQLAGMPADGPIFIALTELPDLTAFKLPKFALIIKVTDYATFRDGFLTGGERLDLKRRAGIDIATIADTPVYFVDRQDWAIVTLDEGLAGQFTKKQHGLERRFSANAAKKMLGSDLSIYVDMAAICKEYGEQLLEFRRMMERSMVEEAKQKGLNREFVELAKELVGWVYRVVRDTETILITIDVEPEGLRAYAEVQVGADTKTNAFLKGEKTSVHRELGNLPEGNRVFTSALPVADDHLYRLVQLLMNGQDPAVHQAMELQRAARTSLAMSAFQDRTESTGLSVTQCGDPAKLTKGTLDFYRALDPAKGPFKGMLLLREKPLVRIDAEKRRGFQLHLVQLKFDLEAMVELSRKTGDLRAKVEDFRRDLGGDERLIWFGTDGSRFVEITAKNWATAAQLLDAYLDGKGTLGEQPAYQAVRRRLPAETTFLYIEDVTLWAQAALDFTATSQGLKPVRLSPPPRGKESYLGFALGLLPGRATLDIWAPGTYFPAYLKGFAEMTGGR